MRNKASRRWDDLTTQTLSQLDGADPLYRPTNFWGPGVDALLGDLRSRGLETFKSWPTSRFWFYPVYGNGFINATIAPVIETAVSVNSQAKADWITGALNGVQEVRRDFDAVRLGWDQSRWPMDLEGRGESQVGAPPQRYKLTGKEDVAWGRAYLNYLLVLAGLSRHVEQPPKRFLELGGGFGVLGEIVLSRDPAASYVDLDIPPLVTVASYYLTELFGERRVATALDVPAGEVMLEGRSAVLPSWRMPDVRGHFDVFVNSYSFQEMEPAVVANYARLVADLGVEWVVSLNSAAGKQRASAAGEFGALDPVTSASIVALFESHGYAVEGRYRSPLLNSWGELVVLRRTRAT